MKEAVKIDTLHETRTYGKALCLLSLNCVASEVTVGFLKLFSANAPRFLEDRCSLEGSQALPICSSEGDDHMKISTEHWWYDIKTAVSLNYI